MLAGDNYVNEPARQTGTSIRTFERIFARDLGISAKKFIRLVRFHNSVERIRSGRYTTLADVAHEFGYTDQSHFINEFRLMSGKLPSEA